MKRRYWPGLFAIIYGLQLYANRYAKKLPTDLPNEVKAVITAANAATAAMVAYDASHAGGEIV